MKGTEDLEDLGVDWKAILAYLREGGEEGVEEGQDLDDGRGLGVRLRLAIIFTLFLFSPV